MPLTAGSQVGANIIAMYPSTSLFIAVGQLAIAVLVMFSYPLQVHPCRNCLDKVFHAGHVVKQVGDPDDEDAVPEDDHGGSHDMSPLKHTILTIAIVASGFTIAYFVDDLQMGTPRVPCPCEYPELILLPDVQCYPLLAPQGRPRSLSSYPVFSTGRSVHTG